MMNKLGKCVTIFMVLVLSMGLMGCTPIASSMNAKILVDVETGQIYKVHWLSGQGAKFMFYKQVTEITSCDEPVTSTVWNVVNN